MDVVVRGLPFVYAYVDNLLVASSSPEEHLQYLRLLFKRRRSMVSLLMQTSVSSELPR